MLILLPYVCNTLLSTYHIQLFNPSSCLLLLEKCLEFLLFNFLILWCKLCHQNILLKISCVFLHSQWCARCPGSEEILLPTNAACPRGSDWEAPELCPSGEITRDIWDYLLNYCGTRNPGAKLLGFQMQTMYSFKGFHSGYSTVPATNLFKENYWKTKSTYTQLGTLVLIKTGMKVHQFPLGFCKMVKKFKLTCWATGRNINKDYWYNLLVLIQLSYPLCFLHSRNWRILNVCYLLSDCSALASTNMKEKWLRFSSIAARMRWSYL